MQLLEPGAALYLPAMQSVQALEADDPTSGFDVPSGQGTHEVALAVSW